MGSVAILGVLLTIGCVFSYPAFDPQQDYLDYVAEQALLRGRDMMSGGRNGPGVDVLYGSDYPPQIRLKAVQNIEYQMKNKGQGGAELTEEEPATWNGALVDVDWNVPASAKIGQIGGVAVCPEGFPHVFHRAGRTWDTNLFDANNVFSNREPIENNTVLTLNKETGEVVDAWGAGTFYMPHGLTIDDKGNLWLTDVALHQVLKYSPEKELLLTLGEAFVPGNDEGHFCKPTQVAVASNGDFFVADGYCNHRVVKYDSTGKYLGEFGEQDGLEVPHGLALLEKYDAICVADRENERIVCYDAGLRGSGAFGERLRIYDDASMGRVYGIAFSPQDDLLYGVGLGDEEGEETQPFGFTIDVTEEQIYYTDVIRTWAPREGFTFPHAMAISPDGEAVYVGELYSDEREHPVWKFVKAEQLKEEVKEEPEQVVDDEEDEEEEEEEEEENEGDEDKKVEEVKEAEAKEEDMKEA